MTTETYKSKSGACSLQLPTLRKICMHFHWKDTAVFQELTDGFRPLAPGLGWKRRADSRYADPLSIPEFLVNNNAVCL